MPAADIVAELPDIAATITAGTFDVDSRAVPLADAGRAWAESARTTTRLVLVPRP